MLIVLFFLFSVEAFAQPPAAFEQAKSIAREQIYYDRNNVGTTYCTCHWKWLGKSGGRVNFKSCGYAVRAEGQRNRAERIEWEHILC